MTPEQMSTSIIKIMEDLSAMKESLKSAHKRIDENDALTFQIHKLATSVETLALQVKTQNDRMENLFNSLESRMKSQGDRISELEKKPGLKWEAIAEKSLFFVVTAIIALLLAKIGL